MMLASSRKMHVGSVVRRKRMREVLDYLFFSPSRAAGVAKQVTHAYMNKSKVLQEES